MLNPEKGTSPVQIAIVIAYHGNRVLVRRRPAEDPLLAGLWEFPGGHVQSGEARDEAAAREFQEETQLDCGNLVPMESRRHQYKDGDAVARDLELTFYTTCFREAVAPPIGGWSWRPIAELADADVPAANRTVVDALRQRLTADSSSIKPS